MELAVITAKQVAVLFLLIFAGFACVKTGAVKIEAKKAFSDLLLYLIVPAMVINSYLTEFDPKVLQNLLQSFALSTVLLLLGLVITFLLTLRIGKEKNTPILRFACIFSNAAYKGTFFGNGQSWWHWKKLQQQAATALCEAQSKGIPPEDRVFATREAALRPSFLQLISCKNIVLEQFTTQDGPQWTIHPIYCEHLHIHDLTVETQGPNTDGLTPDSCSDMLIENCTFRTGDDCIAVNSGMRTAGA